MLVICILYVQGFYICSLVLRAVHIYLGLYVQNNDGISCWNWNDTYDLTSTPPFYLRKGFKEGKNACCGTGPYGGVFTCGGTKQVKHYEVCSSTGDHVWWDSFHPTERIHEQFAKTLWNGSGSSFYAGPYNLEEFFKREKLTIADMVDAPKDEQIYWYAVIQLPSPWYPVSQMATSPILILGVSRFCIL